MTVFSLLSGINLFLSIALFIVATLKLRDIKSDIALHQIIAPASVISVAMMVLHLIGLITNGQYTELDVVTAAWRVVDMITLLLVIRLIKIIKE